MSCYIFVTESFDGARDGAFRFPSGSVIPARGFISAGGPNSGATINLAAYCSSNQMLTNNTRWYLDNGDAWVALYNSTGTLIDAVFWTVNAGESAKWPSDSDLDDTPPYIPTGAASSCPSVASLSRPTSTIGSALNQIEYAGVNPPLGQVLERTVDGGTTWASGAGTINNCNGACVVVVSCVLPVELTGFNVESDSRSVLLNWTTESEKDNAYFNIQRSINGVDWEFVEQVDGAGNSTTPLNYTIRDSKPYFGLSYYQLIQVDLSGRTNYKDIKSVNHESLELMAYPNPTSGMIKLSGVNNLNEKEIEVFDLQGVKFDVDASMIVNNELNLSSFENGIYYIMLMNNQPIKIVLSK
jgi:hypothetical protein